MFGLGFWESLALVCIGLFSPILLLMGLILVPLIIVAVLGLALLVVSFLIIGIINLIDWISDKWKTFRGV